MKRSIDDLRADTRRRLHRETLSAALFVILAGVIAALTATDSLPSIHGGEFASSFLSGFLLGLLLVALVCTLKKIVELRRAIADDTALRRLANKENDELEQYRQQQIGRTFLQVMPVILVIAVIVAGLVSIEALVAVAALAIVLSLVFCGLKLYYRHATGGGEE